MSHDGKYCAQTPLLSFVAEEEEEEVKKEKPESDIEHPEVIDSRKEKAECCQKREVILGCLKQSYIEIECESDED